MSLSINTNVNSMIALENLSSTQSQLSQTQNAISTGKKVSTASDNPASYGIASQINNDISGQNTVNDGLSYASRINTTASSALSSIGSVLDNLRGSVTSLGQHVGDPASLARLNDTITGQINQINTIARNSTLQGVNLLTAGTGDGLGITTNNLSFVTGLRGETQTTSGFASTFQAETGATGQAGSLSDLLGLSTGTVTGGDATGNVFVTGSGSAIALATAGSQVSASGINQGTKTLASLIDIVSKAKSAVLNVSGKLGANQQTIDTMSSFGQVTSDSLTAAGGALTDADMASESAKQTSLQTKQSLGIKSLSISNSQSQNILQLFQ
ncbi:MULTISPECIES: flagellin [unclassified Saccharibacter]|uniref:flagellin n=1 Tax=unclassified Saccharibacter TaxID=2648722 RepID=UPI001324EF78|nr:MULTISPECIES: flagellin [unclassified Saccharibacter]MXV35990.1 flagellin C [Saccharibacter sp. EH611]MXV56849.1 flagellin C [Saccharibacter sp. EH70]MXV66791.1 flagellin C [Saccharibacter sp. EH60]